MIFSLHDDYRDVVLGKMENDDATDIRLNHKQIMREFKDRFSRLSILWYTVWLNALRSTVLACVWLPAKLSE